MFEFEKAEAIDLFLRLMVSPLQEGDIYQLRQRKRFPDEWHVTCKRGASPERAIKIVDGQVLYSYVVYDWIRF
jgi:hypothetical protein